MSEPIVKRGRPERTWQTGTSREYWELIRQRRYKEGRALVEERCLHGDAEAHCEMARLLKEEGYLESCDAHLTAALLTGHPLAFVQLFVLRSPTNLHLVVAMLDPFYARNCDPVVWAVNYIRQSGSALAQLIFHRMLPNRYALPLEETCHLRSRIMAEETSLGWILSPGGADFERRDIVSLAERGVPRACFKASGGARIWTSKEFDGYSYAERQAWLIRAAEQGDVEAAETLVGDAATHAPDQMPWAARQLLATIRRHLNPRNTVGRWSLRVVLQRACMESMTPPQERERAVYRDFLCQHFVPHQATKITQPIITQRHGFDCDLCELLRRSPVNDRIQQRCLADVLPVSLQKRDECKAAAVALFGVLHRRMRVPRDLARFIAKQVWESRLNMPWYWGVLPGSSLHDIKWRPAVFLGRE